MNENIQLKWRHDIHGIGAFAKTELAKGSVVGEYFGEIEIKGDHCDPNMRFQTSIKLGGEVIGYIDAVRVGSWTRFINHSCNGNVRFEPRRLGNLARNVVKVNRTISAEEEITIDYGDSYWKHWKEKGIHCQCGEASCRLNKAVSGSPPKKEQYGE
ncbi:SET domain-containing protein [Polyplosphaeria fusca]|uniref:SET domain-containing protein n=1 Tax=Polyplosphaeria fusca TaxID=682080 RepID=A0A9P4QJL4_9PLEO|nr:SET domain-containing protein [Polyplosphaeria fusca]